MPTWLLTTTFYGQWLPGDPRGSITSVRDHRPGDPHQPTRLEHNRRGDPYEGAIVGLQRAARCQLKGPPVSVTPPQAEELLAQLLETAAFRGWTLHAASIMSNHIHLVVEAPAEVGKGELLRDFKSYAACRLNRAFSKPESGTWWTDGGSCRVVKELSPAIYYVCHHQPHPLLIWSKARGRIPVAESNPENEFPGQLPSLTR